MAAGNRAIRREAQRRRGVRKRPPYRPVEAVSRAETTHRTPAELEVLYQTNFIKPVVG